MSALTTKEQGQEGAGFKMGADVDFSVGEESWPSPEEELDDLQLANCMGVQAAGCQ